LKHHLAQFVLVLTLLCNPTAGLAASVSNIFDTENSAMGQMPCQKELLRSQTVDQGNDGDQTSPMDCCDDDDCSMDLSCQNCLNPHFGSAILLETLDICFSFAVQDKLGLAVGYLSDRSTLPEIHPPNPLFLS
jgi:hypothetical protein